MRWCAKTAFIIIASLLPISRSVSQDRPEQQKLPATVADSIRMARLSDVGTIDGSPVLFSPDRSQFVTVLRQGDLEHNTNVYSIVLFQSKAALLSPTPRTILKLSSTSNRPAIDKLMWLGDNVTLVFLGEQPNGLHRLYSLNTRTTRLTPLVVHQTNIVSYTATPKLERIVFLASAPAAEMLDEQSQRMGLIVSTQRLPDLLMGKPAQDAGSTLELYVKTANGAAKRIAIRDQLLSFPGISISPNGK